MFPSYSSLCSNDAGRSTKEDVFPITIGVNKLSYSITNKPAKWWQKITSGQMPWEWLQEEKTTHILKEVSFTAPSGKLMAIMGGSGSGKTSLLDVLACRHNSGTVTGDVYLNSVVRTKAILDSCAGYVRQEDRLIAFLTVKETLTFVARLKLPKRYSKATVEERVDKVIDELGLRHVADTKVGGETIRGVSGGERRRVSIGIQLIISPSVLLLDEPTSGLDSFTAGNLVQTLGKMAANKRTVIMSIHQPRFDIFNIVDVMMIMSKGKIVYNGPSRDMVNYFTMLGFPCPPHINPCDFYIDLATVDGTNQERQNASLKVVQDLQAAYQVQEEAFEQLFDKDQLVTEEQFRKSVDSGVYYYPVGMKGRTDREKLQNMLDAFAKARSCPGFFVQLWLLLIRFVRVTVEDYPNLIINLVQATMMSCLLGTAYFGLDSNQLAIRDWFGLMFNMSVMYPYLIMSGIIGTCHDERKFLYFELQDKLYHQAAYYGARLLNDVPFHLVYSIFYCIPVYAMAGLDWDFDVLFKFYVFIALSVFTSRCMAMMMAALFPSYQLSVVMAQTFFALFIMSTGFFINLDNMLKETKWISLASYLRWGFQAVCLVQIGDKTFDCEGNAQCLDKGKEALQLYGLGNEDLGICASGLGGTIAVFLILMYVGMRYIPQKPSNE